MIKYTTFKTRLKFYNAYLISTLRYMAPAYITAPAYLLKKLNTGLINIAKSALGYKCYRLSHAKILKLCGWTDIQNLCYIEVLKSLHKLFRFKRPKILYDLFNIPTRLCKSISIKNYKKSKLLDNIFMYKALPKYNALKSEIKQLRPKGFYRKLKKTCI